MTQNENLYIRYLSDRSKVRKAILSEAEKSVRMALGAYGAAGRFRLLLFQPADCYLYECTADEAGKLFRIMGYRIFSHGLERVFGPDFPDDTKRKFALAYHRQGDRFVYDSYYDCLCPALAAHNEAVREALREIPAQGDLPLFVAGMYGDSPAVAWALQEKAGRVVPMGLVQPRPSADKEKIRCRFPEVMGERYPVHARPKRLLRDCVVQEWSVAVPLSEETLESPFWHTKKWKDILPNTGQDCEIAGVPCKWISLKIDVDGFANVFCRVRDARGNVCYPLIYDALGEAGKLRKPETRAAAPKPVPAGMARRPWQSHKYKPLKKEALAFTHFVVDTNALLDCTDLIPTLLANRRKVVVTLMAFREINRFKDNKRDERNQRAEIVYRQLVDKRADSQFIIREAVTAEDLKELPIELQRGNSSNDDMIYAIAIRHKKAGEKVCIVTSDGGFNTICNRFPDLQDMGKDIPCLRPDNIVEMK